MKRGILVLVVLILSLNLVLACVEDNECTSDAPLCSPIGDCITDATVCSTDTDCSDFYDYYSIYGTICDTDNTCIVKEKISASACSSDDDCTAPGSGLCSSAGACIADAKGCIVDDDCSYYYEYYGIYGAICSSVGTCVYNDAIFDTEPSECLIDYECVSLYGSDYECEGSYCVSKGTSAGFVCGDGYCKGAEKNLNSPYYCSDDCESGDEGAVCVTRLDCNQGLDCVSGVCVKEGGVASGFSDVSSSISEDEASWLPCVDEWDCYEGEYCVDGYCELEEFKICFDDIECDESYFCSLEGYCELASEVATDEGLEYCDADYPCVEGFYCDENYCVEYIDTDVNFGVDSAFGFLKTWNEGLERGIAVTKKGKAEVLEKQIKEREREFKQAQQLCVQSEDEQCSNFMERVDKKMSRTAEKGEKFVEKNKDKIDNAEFDKLEMKVGGMVGGGREMAMKAKMIEEVGDVDPKFKERLESDVDVVIERMEMAGRDTSRMQFKDRKVENFESKKVGLEAKFAERGVGEGSPLRARPEAVADRPVKTPTSAKPTKTPTSAKPTKPVKKAKPTSTASSATAKPAKKAKPVKPTGAAITGFFNFLFFAE